MPGAALLIGNSRYRPLPPLETPVGDIELLGDRLHGLGFDTYVLPDANFHSMTMHIAEFGEKVKRLPPDSSVLFYFAGHGSQVRGENFLIPIDAAPPTSDEWRMRAVALSALLGEISQRRDQQKLIALDACRTNGVASAYRDGALGLAGVSTERYADVHETMVLYAAPPGQVARDGGALGTSPFCRALLDALEKPERPLLTLAAEVARKVKQYTGDAQVPWKTDNLIDTAEMPFWRPPPAKISMAAIAPTPGPPPPQGLDAEVAAKGHLIHKLRAKDATGRWAYYFVLVEPPMEAAFLRAIQGDGDLMLDRYGQVVASNYGEEPTQEIRAYLKERYGFDV